MNGLSPMSRPSACPFRASDAICRKLPSVVAYWEGNRLCFRGRKTGEKSEPHPPLSFFQFFHPNNYRNALRMNDLQFQPINQRVTSSLRFRPFSSQKVPSFALQAVTSQASNSLSCGCHAANHEAATRPKGNASATSRPLVG
jgi:hypothetical protein